MAWLHPEIRFAENKRRFPYVGYDLGDAKMVGVSFDADLEPLVGKKAHTEGFEGAKAGLKRTGSLIDASMKEARLKARDLEGIEIGRHTSCRENRLRPSFPVLPVPRADFPRIARDPVCRFLRSANRGTTSAR